MKKELFTLVLLLILPSYASALKNPSQVYCAEMGYVYYTAQTPTGQRGLCKLPDGSLVDSWKFLEGKLKTQYSICEKDGYEIKTVADERCQNIYSDECAVCITEDGEKEISEYMGLNFIESTCGDGVCGLPENYKTCPEDCEGSSEDGLCNTNYQDGCDPDCMPDEDLDCQDPSTTPEPAEGGLWCMPALTIILAATLTFFSKTF